MVRKAKANKVSKLRKMTYHQSKAWDNETKSDVRWLYEQGVPVGSIAKNLGTSEWRVRVELKEMGVLK